jgi:hypothetical protein
MLSGRGLKFPVAALLRSLPVIAITLAGTLFCRSLPAEAVAPRDIVLLVETAHNLAGDDPAELFKPGLNAFLRELSGDTRVAVLGFDTDVRVMLPLRPVTDATRERVLSIVRDMDYGSGQSNSAIALERAIYELKNTGRASAARAIIFIGNGVIETGNSTHDVEFAQWLHGDLLGEAVNAGIRLFWLVPAASADFKSVQTLTHKTGGAYFRASDPETFYDAFTKLDNLLGNDSRAHPAPGDVADTGRPAGEWPPAWLVQGPALRILLGVIIASVAVLTVIMYLRRRRHGGRTSPGVADRAEVIGQLRDLSGFTGALAHELVTRHTRISRRPGLDSNSSRTLVIDDSNISRNHALIECRNDGFWIADLGSVNGTYVNNERVSEQPQPLRSGDTVRFARYEFEFTIPGKQEKARIIPSASRFPGSHRQSGNDAQAAAGGDDASALQTKTGRDDEDATQLRPKH